MAQAISMYLLVPTPALALLTVLQDAPAPRPDQGSAQTQTTQTHRIRRIPLPVKPPFRFRIKVGPLVPEDAPTRVATGDVHLRIAADILPFTAQRGSLRGAGFSFLTVGYSDGIVTGESRTLRTGFVSLSQRLTLPRHPRSGPVTGPVEPSRFSYGGGVGLYALQISGAGSSEIKLQLGTNLALEYLVGKNIFMEADYDFLFAGVKGYHPDGPSLMVGRRF